MSQPNSHLQIRRFRPAKASSCRPDIGGGSLPACRWRSPDLKWSGFRSIEQADTSGNRSLEPALQTEISSMMTLNQWP